MPAPFASPPAYNLLSIGRRGVGKTVFLAGSYAELHAVSKIALPGGLSFECRDESSRRNLARILDYVAETGTYPPLTLKITDFEFSLTRQGALGRQRLCHFRWRDIPGEICHARHPDFQEMILSSHGCCLFVDAAALTDDPGYTEELATAAAQVRAIATLAYLNRLAYTFAIVLTKCDLVAPGEEARADRLSHLKIISRELDSAGANYRIFESTVPLVQRDGRPTLVPAGGAAALVWLVSELTRAERDGGLLGNLSGLLARLHSGRGDSPRVQPG
jgi:hypothetical protein